jgi:ligand-binding sensor domain-containing protein/two-component sensor histidine kinase
MLRRMLISFLFFTAFLKSFSQPFDLDDFSYYGPRSGLSNNYVSGLKQDAAGFIWIATLNGLNRFDGKIFKGFYYSDKYNAIPDNVVYSMNILKNEELGIATDDGAQIISTKTLEQKNLSIDTDKKLRYWSNACKSVLSDADGNYGVSTKTGFYIFSSTGRLKKRYDFYTSKDIGVEWMLFGDDIYLLPDGNMMQLNKNGALLYDRKADSIVDATIKYPALKPVVKEKNNNLFFFISRHELVHINAETNSFDLIDLRTGKISSLTSCIDLGEHIGWITAPSKIDDSTWAVNCKTKGFFLLTIDPVTKRMSCSPEKYFADKLCTNFFVDRNNKLWIGTTEGFFKQNSHPKIVQSFALPNPANNPVIVTALLVRMEKIFAGTADDRIFILDKKTKSLVKQLKIPETSYNIRTFYLFHPDTVWVGTGNGLWWLNLKNYSVGKIKLDTDAEATEIYDFYGDTKGKIWVVTNAAGRISYYDRITESFKLIDSKTNPLFKTNITSIAEDVNGNIWMGGDAIVRWNITKQRIDTLIENLEGQRNMKKGYNVMADSKAQIWTTVYTDEIVNLTRSVHIRPENLLIDKGSYVAPALFQDKILVPTANGPGYYDIRSGKAVLFTINDGLPEGNITSYIFSGDNNDSSVWFSCKNIICQLPLQSARFPLTPPQLYLTSLSILDDTIFNYPPQKISLSHKQEDVNIFYSAVNYTDPGNMVFFYRIKNKKDSSWIAAGDRQNILLTNIAPGNYKLELKVSAFDNKWPEQIKEIEISIKPPFSKTITFYILLGLIISALAYILYRYRVRQIEQKANIDRLLTQTEMKALHAQMNPHFIFNCLNSIREMILNNENEAASLYLSKFARLIRITLNQSSQPFVSLTETIDYLTRYLEMEKIRSDHFTYTVEVGEDLRPDDIMLPPMLIQPFIENAIWHGTAPKHKMKIRIGFKKTGNELVCIVEDDGIGIEESLRRKQGLASERSVGIENIKHRIELLNEKYNLRSSVRIDDKSKLGLNNGTGTIVTLHLPIKSNESLWTS